LDFELHAGASGCGTPLRLALAGSFAQSHTSNVEVRSIDRSGGLLAPRLVQPARVHGVNIHNVDQL
jgi:hypothetical protein